MLDTDKNAFVALAGTKEIHILPHMANRHGLITGATGTGKTVTLQTLAETFSQMGVPVFAADVKGDLSGVAAIGGNKESVLKRVESYGLKEKGFAFQAFPVQFWDVFGERGAPVRASVADMGPLLLGRLLALNETQAAVRWRCQCRWRFPARRYTLRIYPPMRWRSRRRMQSCSARPSPCIKGICSLPCQRLRST